MTAAIPSTPLRALDLDTIDGVHILGTTDVDYLDGAEQKLIEILRTASDLSSLSDELEHAGEGWAERYHLSRERASALRLIGLPSSSTVLEIGSGCGAVTRYLAEATNHVDAVEPVLARAKVGARRVAECDNARVFCGTLEQVPAEHAYDVVVINGVLEYVGNGSAESDPYVRFLEEARDRLRPGGVVIVAIENRLGVKYVAGAPEDHGGIPFQGIENYPTPAPARTFTRHALETLITDAGLKPQTLHAFPDYKMTRALLTDKVLSDESLRGLAWRIPRFPSPDAGAHGLDGVSERQLWHALLEEGIAGSFGNSHVVIAYRADESASPEIWPVDRLAGYMSAGRRATFCVQTLVTSQPDQRIAFHRTRLQDDERIGRYDGLELRATDDTLRPGTDAVVWAAQAPDPLAAATSILGKWRTLLPQDPTAEQIPIDLVPHNVLVGDDGTLTVVDQEWFGPATVEQLEIRGIALFARDLANLVHADTFPDCDTVGDVVTLVAEHCGVTIGASELRDLVVTEAHFQSTATGIEFDTARSILAQELIERPLDTLELGQRRFRLVEQPRLVESLRREIDEAWTQIRLEQQWHQDQADRAEAAEARERELQERLDAMLGSRGWQTLERLRGLRPGR